MRCRTTCIMGAAFALAFAQTAGAFEKIALVDSFDFIKHFDCETMTGTVQVIEYIAGQVGATSLYWRHQTGGVPRYDSREESSRLRQPPFEKRTVDGNTIYGWSNLARGETNLLAYALGEIRARGLVAGVHHTWEENHGPSWSCSVWNLDHPEYSTRSKHGIARPGYTSSLGYNEVLEHKLKRFDEVLAMEPSVIYLDMWRGGRWHVSLEYSAPVCDRWRSIYGCEPPDNPADERWLALCSTFVNRYIRALRERIDRTGRRIDFILAIPFCDLEDREVWSKYALDWKKLAAEGVFDAISVMSVKPDPNRIWESTREIYEYVYRNRGRAARVYFPVSQYNYTYGIPSYCKATGLPGEQVAAKLLELAVKCGGAGVTFECVDFGNYPKETQDVIRRFNK